MKTEQLIYSLERGWEFIINNNLSEKAQLLLVFGERELLKVKENIDYLKSKYPNAEIFGCSTSGEICDTRLFDENIICTAVWFEKSYKKKVHRKFPEAMKVFHPE